MTNANPDFVNRLANETSLYLKQHSRNPVDWYPWGEEAFERARKLNRPIFLSIGYSACHWCHVMEHESFENPEIAGILNEHFVSVKVDREERPDVDQIYMTSLQMLTREGGGWPLSVFLTPNLTPFYAGTYFPPDERYAPQRPSFPRLLRTIIDAWHTRPEQLVSVGQQIAEHLQQLSREHHSDQELTSDLLRRAFVTLKRIYDPVNGGFGHAPKFPHALELRLLLRIAHRFQMDEATQMVQFTLTQMARAGIYDQIGGGFHRYSVDAMWLVPHFEKMLYDNALLTSVYVDAYQVTGDEFFRTIACEILDYVLREMTSSQGGFYSTQDADSEGEEGKFYVWSDEEFEQILGEELATVARTVFAVIPPGNFEGHNILTRSSTDQLNAYTLELSITEFQEQIALIRQKLYEARAKRVWPGRDEKILASWNGLMIAAFAQAGAAFHEPKYLEAACRAAEFVLTRMRDHTGRLFRCAGENQPAKLSGILEDYAYLAEAFVTLYEATYAPQWLKAATELADVLLRHFADTENGGFYYTADDHEKLIARIKDSHDGSVPSGNAVAVTALLKLAAYTGKDKLRSLAERALTAQHGMMADQPHAAGQMLTALDFYLGPIQEIAIVGKRNDPDTERVLQMIRGQYQPNRIVAFHDSTSGTAPTDIPLLADKHAHGKVTLFKCENFTCEAPLIGLEAIEKEWRHSAER